MPVPSKIYCLNELGQRKNNEDSIMPPSGQALLGNRLFLVCDGVGGNARGEVASELSCRYFNDYFDHHLQREEQLNTDFINAARDWVIRHFHSYIEEQEHAENMSTTLTLAYLKQDSVFVAWCGDSRIYLIRNGEVVFQSTDHSLVNELVRRGDITVEEALTHPHRNVITRSLQARIPYAEIQTEELFDIQENDYLLLCTDGLLEQITPEVLRTLLSVPEDEHMIEQFQAYCYQQTRDNYSMYLIALNNLQQQPLSAPIEEIVSPATPSRSKAGMVSLLILLILLVAIYAGYHYNFFQVG